MTHPVDLYLTDDDKAAIRANRGRQLAEQHYALSLVVPADEAEANQKAHNLALLETQLAACADPS